MNKFRNLSSRNPTKNVFFFSKIIYKFPKDPTGKVHFQKQKFKNLWKISRSEGLSADRRDFLTLKLLTMEKLTLKVFDAKINWRQKLLTPKKIDAKSICHQRKLTSKIWTPKNFWRQNKFDSVLTYRWSQKKMFFRLICLNKKRRGFNITKLLFAFFLSDIFSGCYFLVQKARITPIQNKWQLVKEL